MTSARLWSPFGLHYGWVIVGSAIAINLATTTFSPVIFSFFVVPMSEDLGTSRGELSWALTFRLLTAGITGPFLGQLVDRFGTRWMGALAGMLAGASLIALSQVHSLWLLYLVYAISGFAGFGGSGGALLTLVPVGKWFVRKRGRAMAFASLGSTAGTAIALLAAGSIIGAFDWRTAWIVFGIAVVAVVAPVSAIFMRRAPEDHGLRPDGDAAFPEHAAASADPPTVEISWTRGEALRTRTAWQLIAATVLMGFAISGTLIYRVAFWQDLGMSPSLVAFGTATDPLTVVFSAFLFGFLAERVPIRFIGLAGGCGFGLSMLPMIFTGGETYTIFLHNIIWGFFAGAYVTTNNMVWATYFGRRSLGAIQGVILPALILSNGLAAPAYGALLDHGVAARTMWSVSLLLFAVGGLLVFSARPPARPRSAVPVEALAAAT